MLVIHHAIINPQLHRKHWTEYMYPLRHSPGQRTNVVIAAHAVWLMTFLPLDDKYDFQRCNYDWLAEGHDFELHSVNGILGLSRKMLHFQYIIRMKAKERYQQRQCLLSELDLLKEIEESPQLLDGREQKQPFVEAIATTTMRAYKIATRLYARVRLFR